MASDVAAGPGPAHVSGSEDVRDVQETRCCVVGGGPGGVMLALLLARRGVHVTLLEAHKTFDRDFRGDSLHPAILEILDDIGLAEGVHQLPHVKMYAPTVPTADGPFTPFDLRRLRTRFPYVLFVHQHIFLEFLAREAAKYPHFRLVLGANVQRLLEVKGVVHGVRYRGDDGWHEVRALLTVGADGRFSRVRRLAGFKPVVTGPPFEILWLRLPHYPDEPRDLAATLATLGGGPQPMAVLSGEGPEGEVVAGLASFGRGHMIGAFNRGDHWQMGYFCLPGEFPKLRTAGLDAFRRTLVEMAPVFARHLEHLTDWRQVTPLSVEPSRCRRWYRPGLLLIGDAAHVMTPFAGAGIKYAIEDAVVAANVLTGPLAAGRVSLHDLVTVQRRREWPTRFIQAYGAVVGRYVLARVLRSRGPLVVPRGLRLLFGLPFVGALMARLLGIGLWRVRVQNTP